MAFASYAAYQAARAAPTVRIDAAKGGSSISGSTGLPNSTWTSAFNAGTAPTTAAECTNATVGAYPFISAAGSGFSLLFADTFGSQPGGFLLLADRLSHQGELSGTTSTAQSTNLPTYALPRYTSGVGVWAALEVYTTIGTGCTTACTVEYTDQGGNSSTSPGFQFGVTGYCLGRRMIPIPLATGNTGVRAVSSVTLGSSSGTAGAFGVTLFKPLVMIPRGPNFQENYLDALLGLGAFPTILNGACLMWIDISTYAGVSEFGAFLGMSEV